MLLGATKAVIARLVLRVHGDHAFDLSIRNFTLVRLMKMFVILFVLSRCSSPSGFTAPECHTAGLALSIAISQLVQVTK